MTEKASRMCCLIRETMFFAEFEGALRQSFDNFVLSHESMKDRRKNITPRGIMRIGWIHRGLHLNKSLASNIPN
jgi:hypothetical protein